MARLTIELPIAERDALFKLARKEERDPRAQVRLIIRQALEQSGDLHRVENTPVREVKHATSQANCA